MGRSFITIERIKMSKKPNKIFAPIVIAGVTIGFLASAYKFVFAKPNQVESKPQKQQDPENSNENKEQE